MADTKITDLPVFTEPNDNDLLVAVDDPAGSPVTKSITMANAIKKIIPDATDSIKGKASFNSTDFNVSSGAVSLKNKTSYLSVHPYQFQVTRPDVNLIIHEDNWVYPSKNNVGIIGAGLSLPHGAVITGAIVWGSNASKIWDIGRTNHSGTASAMGSGNMNSEDTSITNTTVDNLNYSYFISSMDIDSNEKIYGARITYTTDYD